ncbi:MAG: hypothetical protein II954_11690 [Synergistaceae bacterium]|nr:hypothetical protein [Synergistaceae bacterium]
MPLMECRLCGRIFTEGGRKNVCPKCLRRLGDLYAEVHEYMRDHDDEEFDIDRLSDAMDASPMDIQALVDLGYIERDISLYGTRETKRKQLADAFSHELSKMKRGITTYGGEIYSRSNEDGVRTVRRR